jgi:hypothetical protein
MYISSRRSHLLHGKRSFLFHNRFKIFLPYCSLQSITYGMDTKRCICTMKPLFSKKSMSTFTHIDTKTMAPRMVNVSSKSVTNRVAHARCKIVLPDIVLQKLNESSGTTGTQDGIYALRSAKGPIAATGISRLTYKLAHS